jgi:N-acetylglucosaminyldiphosphoundecaprenol N-acetyl-beta-D-mannosaminyltransferase
MYRIAPPLEEESLALATFEGGAARTASIERIVGFPVRTDPLSAVVDDVERCIAEGGPPRWMAFLNPHSTVVARELPCFETALQLADWIVPDGAGIVLASRLQRGRICRRITGSDVFTALNARLAARGGSVFFLGSTPETLAAITARMAVEFPGVRIAGTLSPPFKAEYTADETDAMIAAVNAGRPDVLWVGMTAPKQEMWIHAHLPRLDVRFAAGIGAVFDFYTGRVRRSHPVFQRLGLEWLPRLVQQPRRLWRRTFVSAPLFLARAVHAAIQRVR